MQAFNPSMCLKVNRDTFVLPQSNNGVYIRNNVTSIRMDGSTIEKWLERLIPMFDGNRSLEHITAGLPDSYKDQVYKIAQVLIENGFVRDVSADLPHQLPDHIQMKYASQIEYLNHISDSGGYRFQVFRQSKVAVMGSGSLLLSLVHSLVQSGHTRFSILPGDLNQNEELRLSEILGDASKSDSDTKITIVSPENKAWGEMLESFDFILYGTKDGDLDELRTIQNVCKVQRKHFLPVTIIKNLAFAGPFVSAESESCWESAYRRIHERPKNDNQSFSSTAGSLLANAAVFELFKEITGVQAKVFENTNERPFYLLNLETLEGNWHSAIPHPLVTGRIHKEAIQDPLLFLEKRNKVQNDLHALFYQMTSKESGIFYCWEEEDLLQLPLSQCKVQVADPRSDSPARLQPEIVCSGLTHEEARLEAGLCGLESYVSQYNKAILGIGTGATALEGLCRALQNGLHEEFVKHTANGAILQSKLDSKPLRDSRSQFLIRALSTLQSKPELYLGQALFGFPVVWVGSNGHWYGSVGLDMKMALNRALQTAVMDAQNKETSRNPYGVVISSADLMKHDPVPHKVPVPPFKKKPLKETFTTALHTLKRNNMQAQFFVLHAESIFEENTAGLFGMTISGEELT